MCVCVVCGCEGYGVFMFGVRVRVCFLVLCWWEGEVVCVWLVVFVVVWCD